MADEGLNDVLLSDVEREEPVYQPEPLTFADLLVPPADWTQPRPLAGPAQWPQPLQQIQLVPAAQPVEPPAPAPVAVVAVVANPHAHRQCRNCREFGHLQASCTNARRGRGDGNLRGRGGVQRGRGQRGRGFGRAIAQATLDGVQVGAALAAFQAGRRGR